MDAATPAGVQGQTYVDPAKRFLLQPRKLHSGDSSVLLAVDTQNGNREVVVKLYADERLRDNTVTALTELRDDRYVVPFADPENRAACVFTAHEASPAAPHAVVLQKGDDSLKDVLSANESLDLSDTRTVLDKVLQAVAYMHSAGWAHCNVNTDNVLEFKNVTYKLLDLDLAAKDGGQLKDIKAEVCPPEVAALLVTGGAPTVSPAIDSWALGCLFFHMLMGAPLIHFLVPGAQEMSRTELLGSLAGVQQEVVDRVIEPVVANTPKINYKNAWSLMDKLLRVDPSQRFTPADSLKHVFFRGGIATDLPGAGRVAPQLDMRLGELGAKMEDVRKLIQKATTLVSDVADKECPATFVIMPEEALHGNPDMKEVETWVGKVVSWFKEPPSSEDIITFLATRKMRLFLVCELSGQRQGDGYVITAPEQIVAKLLPAMQLGFKLLWLAKGVTQVVRCFWPVPVIPEAVVEKAKSTIEALDQKSSVEDFACVQGVLDDNQEMHKTSLVGGSIREFRSFLSKADPTNVWAGLQRFVTADGHVLWVSAAAAAEALKKGEVLGPSGDSGSTGAPQLAPSGVPGQDVAVRPAKTDDERALLEAAFAGNVAAVRMLAARPNVNLNVTNKMGVTCLNVAAEKGYVEVMLALLERGASVAAMQGVGATALHAAACAGQKAAVELLLQRGADATIKNKNGATPLHVAAREGHEAVVELLLGGDPDLTARDNDGATPLLLAAERGHANVVRLLLRHHNAAVSITNNANSTPLHLACHRGLKEVAELLLEHKADVRSTNKHGSTPLHLAGARGHSDVVRLLMKHGAPTTVHDVELWTPLHEACAWGHADVAALLLEDKEVLVDALDKADRTPLHLGCQRGAAALLQLLLDRGADLAAKDKDDMTPLHVVARKGSMEGLELLLSRGADVAARTKTGTTPLLAACSAGNLDAVQVLLKNGADLETKDANGATPLHVAAQEGFEVVVRFLLDRGADVAVKDKDGATPLHLACIRGHRDVINMLLAEKADVEAARDKDGATPLHLVSSWGDKDLINKLLKAGAAVTAKDATSSTPLHAASASGKKDAVEFLLRRGADHKARDKTGCLPLHLACARGHKEVAELLLEQQGTDVNIQDDKYGNTPLHWACSRGQAGVAELLLVKKAHVDSRNKIGSTPLHDASVNGHKPVVELLLKHDANVNLVDRQGKTAYKLAKKNGQSDIAKLLRVAADHDDRWSPGESLSKALRALADFCRRKGLSDN